MQKDKTPNISAGGYSYWWALTDLNCGPNDYEKNNPFKYYIEYDLEVNVEVVCEIIIFIFYAFKTALNIIQ